MVRGLPDVEISKRPLHEFMRKQYARSPQLTALIDGVTERSYTYGELDEHLVRVASGLRRLGVAKGDVVIVYSPNSIEHATVLMSIVANGAIAALTNPQCTVYELQHAINLTKPKWIVTVPELVLKTQEVLKNVQAKVKAMIVISEDTDGYPEAFSKQALGQLVPFEVLKADDGTWYPSNLEIDPPKDAALLLFSSGTTGLPKGVMISHYNVITALTIYGYAGSKAPQIHRPGEQAVVLSCLPMFHAMGLFNGLLRCLMANSKSIILKRFQLEQVLELVQKYKVTLLPLAPPLFLIFSKNPWSAKYLSSVRRFHSGGAHLTGDMLSEFSQVTGCYDVRQGYGLTEMTLGCVTNSPLPVLKPGSVGIPLSNTEMVVVDVTSGLSLGPNQKGEIWVRGPQIMLGYINNPTATKEILDDNGWLHTGDIGYYDEDGEFFIVDRIKELIKYKGFQVAPAELESVILTHPGVVDTAVVGVPDTEAGELPKAFVVRRPGSDVTGDQIKQFVAGRLSTYKHLQGGVEFIDKIPKTDSGKILRRLLKQNPEGQRSRL